MATKKRAPKATPANVIPFPTPQAAPPCDDGDDDPDAQLAALLTQEPVAEVDPRTVPVRFSALKHFARSALHYWQACQRNDEPTLAMRLGTAYHAVMFDQPVQVFLGKQRRGKAWDAFKVAHADKTILNATEYARAQAMLARLKAHPLAARLMFAEGNVYEDQIAWQIGARACASRPDAYNRAQGFVLDYKTTVDATEERFQPQAWRMFYPAQLRFYADALECAQGWRPTRHYLIAQETKAPYDVTVHEVTPECLDVSARIIRLWWEKLLGCEAENAWPGLSACALRFAPPEAKAWDIVADDVDDDGSEATSQWPDAEAFVENGAVAPW